jgi:hypothetical protein
MIREVLDSRVLAAVRFIDATVRTPLAMPLAVRGAEGVRWLRNRAGLQVLVAAPGFATYAETFRGPLPSPAPVPLTSTVHDPSGTYLPRRFVVRIPRDADPADAGLPGSLFQPVAVELFPAPAAALGAGWARVRVSVKRAGTDEGLPFAYVRIRRAASGALLARGLADARGEALVAIPGIPVTSWSAAPGPVTVSRVPAQLTVYFDRDAFRADQGLYPNPDALEEDLATLPSSSDIALELASGRETTHRVEITIAP